MMHIENSMAFPQNALYVYDRDNTRKSNIERWIEGRGFILPDGTMGRGVNAMLESNYVPSHSRLEILAKIMLTTRAKFPWNMTWEEGNQYKIEIDRIMRNFGTNPALYRQAFELKQYVINPLIQAWEEAQLRRNIVRI